MQAVGAQWLFVDDPNAATIVALIQTATTLPMVLLSLPAGVLADIFDRRWLLFFVQCYTITVAATLALLGFQGAISAPLLLSFTAWARRCRSFRPGPPFTASGPRP